MISIYRDLIDGGTSFTIKSNFQEYDDDNDLFPELMTGEEGLNLDNDIIVSPWDKPFAELRLLMTNIGHDIYKKVVKKPVDNLEIQGRCRVTITYNAYMENDTTAFDSTFMRGDHKVFITEAHEVLEGLELAVKSMKRGEESQFVIPYNLLFGERGCEPRIKKKADALFVIQLVKFSEIGNDEATESVNPEDKRKYKVMIGKIMEVKASGMDHFRQGSYVKAANIFHRAINRLEMCQLTDAEEEKEQQQHLITLYINAMNCYNKMDQPKKACSAFRDLGRLTDTKKNVKALYQHGKALTDLGEFVRAMEALKRADQLKPNDPDIAKQMKILDIKFDKHKKSETSLWRKAFGNEEQNSSESYDVTENFKAEIIRSVTAFKNDEKASKHDMPLRLTRDEQAFIQNYVKDHHMKLLTPEIQGNRSCYLIKQK